VVQLLEAIQQTKAHAELRMQCLRVVTNDLKSAAFRGALGSERAHENVPTCFHGTPHLANVSDTLLHRRKEVKYCAVVPHIVGSGRQIGFCNVARNPLDAFCGPAQAPLGYVNRGLRYIKDRDVSVSMGQQIVDQRRFAATNINDGSVALRRIFFDQRKRSFEVCLVPANGVWCFLTVDFFPMCL
jgi:hypothetical protein